MVVLLEIHSIIRWLIMFVGIAALGKFFVGWMSKSPFQKLDRIISSAFVGLLDLQVLLGLILLLWNGLVDGAGFPRYRMEHFGAMILAVALGHLRVRWKNAEDVIRFRNMFFIIIGVFVLIYFGVAVLPGGWTR